MWLELLLLTEEGGDHGDHDEDDEGRLTEPDQQLDVRCVARVQYRVYLGRVVRVAGGTVRRGVVGVPRGVVTGRKSKFCRMIYVSKGEQNEKGIISVLTVSSQASLL